MSLAVSGDGSLWAGTESGVARWSAGHFYAVRFNQSITLSSPSSLSVDPQKGGVWLATTNGIYRLEHERESISGSRAVLATQFPRTSYNGIAFGRDGSIWAATTETVYQWKNGELFSGARMGVPRENWGAIRVDGQGSVWIRSLSRLLSLERGHTRFVAQDRGLPNAEIPALDLDNRGRIMVSTLFGLARRFGKDWEIFGRRNGLPMDSVSSALVDREGSPWIGTNGGGVARWLGFGAWEAWTSPVWMENDAIWAMAQDRGGSMWIGSNRGVLYLPRTHAGANVAPQKRLPIHAPVRAIARGRGNEIWVGTNHQGLFRCEVDSSSCRNYGSASGLTSRDIDRLIIDSQDVLWVSTRSALYSAHLDQFPIRFMKAALPGLTEPEYVARIAKDGQGSVWIAYGNSVWIQRSGKWTEIKLGALALDHQFDQIDVDRSGTVWLSYLNNVGLTAITGILTGRPSARHFTVSNGLQSNFVYALECDAKGAVFVGTDHGIDVWQDQRWRHYGDAEGLVWNDINTSALVMDSLGSLWIGTSRGLSHFRPDQEYRSTLRPVPIITSLRVQGQDEVLRESIQIPYRNRDITIRFSALSFAREAGIRFHYRLLGLADTWTSGEDRDLRLINLAPGSYTLELAARTSDGLQSSAPVRLRIEVATPWWKTPLFYLASGLALLAVCRLVWMWRMRILLARQRELERAVQDRTSALVVERQHLMDAREALREQAMRDPLTKLLNRRAIFESLRRMTEQAIREDQHLAVLMADVDHFKSVNDQYGHQTGDAVLVEIAARFTSAVRSYDAVGRYGGEEFILIFANCSRVEAAKRAEDLRRTIDGAPIVIGGEPVQVTCSFGVSAATGRGIVISELIASADAGLYRAKRAGRNRVVAKDPSTSSDPNERWEPTPFASSDR
jgi:diguanylate cyclase (GGDEF)-like protein